MKLEFSRQIFEKRSDIKFCQNASSSFSHDDRQDMMKLIGAFRNFAHAPKNSVFFPHSVSVCFIWIAEQTAIISL